MSIGRRRGPTFLVETRGVGIITGFPALLVIGVFLAPLICLIVSIFLMATGH